MKDPRLLGIGGAPTRVTTLPTDSAGRKTYPIASGFLDYFPDAIAAIAHMSYVATQQHHPDKPMHWDRQKSKDEDDTMMRHFLQRGTRDEDGERHSVKMAWRALAFLQKEIEGDLPLVDTTTPLQGTRLHFVETPKAVDTRTVGNTGYSRPAPYVVKTEIKDGLYCDHCENLAVWRLDSKHSPTRYFCDEHTVFLDRRDYDNCTRLETL